MSEFLFQYEPIPPTTWVYLSSLLMLGVFFKFNRFWSVRNIDLVLLILLAPGLLMVRFGDERILAEKLANTSAIESATLAIDAPESEAVSLNSSTEIPDFAPPGVGVEEATSEGTSEVPGEVAAATGPALASGESPESVQIRPELSGRAISLMGYVWLLGVLAVFLARLLLDPTMVRRPLLEPNLSTGGLAFLGCSLFVFLMANVMNSPATDADLSGAKRAEQLLAGVADPELEADLRSHGPGNALLLSVPRLVTTPLDWKESRSTNMRYARTAKTMAIMSHLAIVLGIVAIGYRHFGNIKMGIGAATLYLMLPYTSFYTGSVLHVVPAALLVWAVLCYRRPLAAGSFIGFAIGVAYYPIFLLPLWLSFYWQRGLMRFVSTTVFTVLICVLSLGLVSTGMGDFLGKVQMMFGIWLPRTDQYQLLGVWGLGWDTNFRFPILAAFIAISGAFALWPAQKNLGTLLSCSAAVMVATQFWHGDGGGTYLAWFLPLTLLTIFRPNLEDRVALSVLGEGWFPRRRLQVRRVDQAA